MHKYIILTMCVALCACATSTGGGNRGHTTFRPNQPITNGGGNVDPTPDGPDNPNPDIPDIPTPDVPDIPPEDKLAELERLFGPGKGLDGIPTELVSQTDKGGFEYLTFGAWGETYDIRVRPDVNGGINWYDFTDKQYVELKQRFQNADPDDDCATEYKGPAIMMAHGDHSEIVATDYGTMLYKLAGEYGPTIIFDMYNDENDLLVRRGRYGGWTIYDYDDKEDLCVRFNCINLSKTSDDGGVHVFIRYNKPNDVVPEKKYEGYGF